MINYHRISINLYDYTAIISRKHRGGKNVMTLLQVTH